MSQFGYNPLDPHGSIARMAEQQKNQNNGGPLAQLQENMQDDDEFGQPGDEMEQLQADLLGRAAERGLQQTPAYDPETGSFTCIPEDTKVYLQQMLEDGSPQEMARAMVSLGLVNPHGLGVNFNAVPDPAETNAGMDDFDQDDQGDDLD